MDVVSKRPRHKLFITLISLFFVLNSYSENSDSTKKVYHFSGSTLVPYNGISFIPTFSLENPQLLLLYQWGTKD